MAGCGGYPGHEIYIRLHYPTELHGVDQTLLTKLLTSIQTCPGHLQQYACTLGADIAARTKPDTTGTDSDDYFCMQAPPVTSGGGKPVPTILVEIYFSLDDYSDRMGHTLTKDICHQVEEILVNGNQKNTCPKNYFNIRPLKYTEAMTERNCTKSLSISRWPHRKPRETDV